MKSTKHIQKKSSFDGLSIETFEQLHELSPREEWEQSVVRTLGSAQRRSRRVAKSYVSSLSLGLVVLLNAWAVGHILSSHHENRLSHVDSNSSKEQVQDYETIARELFIQNN